MIPFKHGEFWLVCPSGFFLAKTMADLKDLGASSGKKSFHAEFWRSMEKPVFTGERNNIRFGKEDWKPERSIYFKVGAFNKKRANGLQQIGPLLQA